jgi:hypothetical protein
MRKLRTRLGRFAWPGAFALFVAALVAIPVLALGNSAFDSSDGNLTLTDTQSFGTNDNDTKDWENAPDLVTGDDLVQDPDDESFGKGTKEDTAVPTVVDGSIPPNKSDLSHFYVSHEVVSGDAFLYLGWVRTNTLGSANMDFEFNKSNQLSGNGQTPVRTAGDLLITFDFSNGGNQVDLSMLRWVTSGANSQCEASGATTAAGCWGNSLDLDASGFADGAVNDGFATPDTISGGTIVDGGFGEAAINLSDALDLGPNDCEGFAQAFLKSRASDSFTAAAKDFVPPQPVNLNLCKPATVKVVKTDESGNPLAGATFELYRDENEDGTLDQNDTLLDTCTTAIVGTEATCSFDQLTGSGTVHLIVHESQAPAGYNPGPDQAFTVTFSTTPQTITRTFSDNPVPGTINIHKEDDAGNPLQGAVFHLFTDNSPLGPPDGGGPNQDKHGAEDVKQNSLTCTVDSAGDCTIGNVPLGKYWVVETTGVPGYSKAADQYADVGLGSGGGQTINLTFVDPRLHRVIVLTCHQGTNTLVASDVTNGATTKTSLSGAGLTDAEEADLCTLGGASFGGKPHQDNDRYDVDIGKVGGVPHP